MANDVKPKKYADVLRAALEFTEEDLALNEAGVLTEAQIRTLKDQRAGQLVVAAVISVIVALIVLMVAVILIKSPLPLLLVTGIISLIVLLIGGFTAYHLTRDVQEGVGVVEGRIELATNPGENSAVYFVKVEGQKFKVKKSVFLTFKNGDPYRLYYAPHTKTILSVEWLRDDSPFAEERSVRAQPSDALPLLDEVFDDADNLITDDGELRTDAR